LKVTAWDLESQRVTDRPARQQTNKPTRQQDNKFFNNIRISTILANINLNQWLNMQTIKETTRQQDNKPTSQQDNKTTTHKPTSQQQGNN
jgi:hypothetical protein